MKAMNFFWIFICTFAVGHIGPFVIGLPKYSFQPSLTYEDSKIYDSKMEEEAVLSQSVNLGSQKNNFYNNFQHHHRQRPSELNNDDKDYSKSINDHPKDTHSLIDIYEYFFGSSESYSDSSDSTDGGGGGKKPDDDGGGGGGDKKPDDLITTKHGMLGYNPNDYSDDEIPIRPQYTPQWKSKNISGGPLQKMELDDLMKLKNTTTMDDKIQVKNPTTMDDTIQIKNTTTMDGMIQVKNPTTIDDNIQVKNPTTIDDNIQVKNPTTMDGMIQVKNPTTMDDKIQIKSTTVVGDLIPTKTTTVGDLMQIKNETKLDDIKKSTNPEIFKENISTESSTENTKTVTESLTTPSNNESLSENFPSWARVTYKYDQGSVNKKGLVLGNLKISGGYLGSLVFNYGTEWPMLTYVLESVYKHMFGQSSVVRSQLLGVEKIVESYESIARAVEEILRGVLPTLKNLVPTVENVAQMIENRDNITPVLKAELGRNLELLLDSLRNSEALWPSNFFRNFLRIAEKIRGITESL